MLAKAQQKSNDQVKKLRWLQRKLFGSEQPKKQVLEKAKAIVRVCWPMHFLLRGVDSGQPRTHCIYHRLSDTI